MFNWFRPNTNIEIVKLETRVESMERRLITLEVDNREMLGSLRELIGRVRIVLDSHDLTQQVIGKLGESFEGIRRALSESSDKRVAAAANSVPVVNVFAGDQQQVNQGQTVHGEKR